jgi:hypothetical protein
MMDSSSHLRPDELDLALEGKLRVDRTSHIETCEECRTAVEELREVVTQLRSLRSFKPDPGFSELIMASVRVTPAVASEHLSADDLDLWLTGTLHATGRAHLLACGDCRRLADAERTLVFRLERLPLFQPAARFEERVMAQVALPAKPWRARIFATRRSTALAAGIGALVLGSMGTSVLWSMGHQETLTAMGTWATSAATQWTLAAAQDIGARILSQPWALDLRAAATPGRIAALAAIGTALYTGGLLALRRLLALPAPRVARALP